MFNQRLLFVHNLICVAISRPSLTVALFLALTAPSILNITANNNRIIMPKSVPLKLVYLMIPEHNDYIHGAGTLPMRDILVELINRNTTLLANYNVSIDVYDTGYYVEYNVAKTIRLFTLHIASDCMAEQKAKLVHTNVDLSNNCSRFLSEEEMTGGIVRQRPAPLFFGPEFSSEARIIARLATMYNLVQICGGTLAADLSDRRTYPNFFRTVMGGNAFIGVPRALAEYFNYTNVALLPRDEAYADPMQQVDFDLTTHNYNVLFRVKFQAPKINTNNASIDMLLDSITLYDARILFIWSIEADEDRIFCRTIDRWRPVGGDGELAFSAKKFLVVFIGMIEGAKWLEPDAKNLLPNCNHTQLSSMLNGSLLIKVPTWGLPTDKLEFGLTNSELIHKAEALGRSRYHHPTGELAPLLPRAVDAFWLAFLALDALDRRLQTETPPRSLVDFTFQSSDMAGMLKEELMRTRFRGTGGEFKFDANSDVNGRIFIEQYQPELVVGSTKYVKVLSYDTDTGKIRPLENAPMVFGTRDGLPPPDKKLSTTNDLSNSSLLIALIIALCTVLLVVMAAGVGVYFMYRRKVASNMTRPTWLIDFKQLLVQEHRQRLSTLFGLSLMSVDRRSSYISSNIKVAELNGDQTVSMQQVPSSAPQLVVDARSYKLLSALREHLPHDNIVQFIGYSCVSPTEQYLLWEHCGKGSIQQLINENGTLFNLDTVLEYAIMLDVANGMAYLHKSFLRAHGALCAAACLVDKRFSVKVGNYGDHELAELFGLATLASDDEVDEIALNSNTLFYQAPELLRQKHDYICHKSPAADVYAYAITLHVLLTRASPYESVNQLSVEQILTLVRQTDRPVPFRPSLDVLQSTADSPLVPLLRRCWAESAVDRPAFADIVRQLQQISGVKAGSSVTDQLLKRLERYASDMESIVRERTAELEGEKRRSDALLNAMLPPDIANELKHNGHVQPESFDSVTVYFSDIVGFTALSSTSTPIQVVNFLNALYTMFDARIDQFDAYKVETIGDAYMVVSGLPRRNGAQHVAEIAKLSLALLNDMQSFVVPHRPDDKIELRIGLHTGPCVAGVVGTKMPRYCLFGDSINTASRMESSGQPSKIHISNALREALAAYGGMFITAHRGPLEVKGKGVMITYWLNGTS